MFYSELIKEPIAGTMVNISCGTHSICAILLKTLKASVIDALKEIKLLRLYMVIFYVEVL